MTHKTAPRQIVVSNAAGQWATVIAVPSPAISPQHRGEAEWVYGIGGLTVDRISENEFRDFQGTIWTVSESSTSAGIDAKVASLWTTLEELQTLSQEAGCTPEQFAEAVESVGSDPHAVANYLQRYVWGWKRPQKNDD